jgi:hypothetical protein
MLLMVRVRKEQKRQKGHKRQKGPHDKPMGGCKLNIQ